MYSLKLFVIRLAIDNCIWKWRLALDNAHDNIANNSKFYKYMKRANVYADRYIKLASKREQIINEMNLEAWLNN